MTIRIGVIAVMCDTWTTFFEPWMFINMHLRAFLCLLCAAKSSSSLTMGRDAIRMVPKDRVHERPDNKKVLKEDNMLERVRTGRVCSLRDWP